MYRETKPARMLIELTGVWLALSMAVATPLWQPPHLFHTSMGRNIRHLPCVSRRTGEGGTCMFAFSCAKLNGTHLGTCIDRFYFGSCCRMPEDVPGGEVDIAPPDDNSLDGTTTSGIRPAVTQKPHGTPVPPSSSTQYSSPSTTQATTQGFPSSTQGPTFATNGPSFATHGPSEGTTGFTGSTPGQFSTTPNFPSSTQGHKGTSQSQASVTQGFTESTPPFSENPSTQGFTGTPSFTGSTTQGLSSHPAFQQPTTAPPTFVTWTTIEEATGKPPPISIRPQVSESSGGTHKPIFISTTESPSSQKPASTSTTPQPVSSVRPSVPTSQRPPPSSAHPPVSQQKPSSTPPVPSPQPTLPSRPPVSTHRPVTSPRPPPSTPGISTQQVPVSTIRPPGPSTGKPPSTSRPPASPSSSPKPPPSTQRPPTITSRPPPSTAKPPPSSARPPTSSQKPQGSTQKPGSAPRPPVTSPKPKPPQKPPTKPVAKPKPTAKPKPPAKPPTTTRPTTRPTTTTTTTKPSTTTQTATSETWVPVSVSTHAPSTTSPTNPPTTHRPSSPEAPSSTTSHTPGVSTTLFGSSTASVALPSVMSTTPSPTNATTPSYAALLNTTSYKDVCGRRLFPESRVVGGDKSTFGKWPWQISLRQWRTSTYLHKCGAALLNENWAITAAHCVENVPPSDLLLRLGEHDLSIEDEPFGYQERRVQIVASHPQFDPRTFEYDLALLRFYEPVTFQPNIIPICVPEDDTNFVGSTAYVTGWGRLYEDGPLPSVLQEVSVPVINNTLCETMYRAAGYIEHIPDIFICAGWKKGGFDSCEGDSGGPMVIQRPDKRWLLAGVISWGIGCAEPNQPGVYTRISQFRHWINQILQF